MGSDNNCNNYYNVDQSSGGDMTSTPYYQTLSSQNQSPMRNSNNEWMSPDQNSDVNSSSQSQESESSSQHDQVMRESEMISRNQRTYNHPSSQHLQMSAPQWSFPSSLTNPYQRFYSDSQYGLVLSPNTSQQSSLTSTPSASLHSLNSEAQSQQQSLHVHQMKTSQHHLKKVYYQGLATLCFIFFSTF